MPQPARSARHWIAKRFMHLAVLCLVGSAAAFAGPRWLRRNQPANAMEFATVEKHSFEVDLVERGKLESQRNIKVISEVEDVRGDGIYGNAILSIVDNGSLVKQGDLIVSIDPGTHIERVDEQILETDKARADHKAAEVVYLNQVSQNETLRATAELNVKLAELQLAMFKHPANGTHRLEVDELQRRIDDTENEILAAKAKLKLSENASRGLATLYQYGYAGKSELERVRLDALQAQSEVAAKTNRLQTQLANVEKKNEFEQQMSLLKLEGAVKTAKRALEQVELDNTASLAKAQTELDRANKVLRTEDRLLERYRRHLKACEIYAPADGMVAYALPRHSRENRVELGAVVWEGQAILNLPDLEHMQVETAVHETARNLVHEGMAATVRLEALPEIEYPATLSLVELMPDRRRWDEADTKVYKTIARIDENVEGLKPGMTAIVEIHVARPENVLAVPVQAVIHDGRNKYCYVQTGAAVERVSVKLGHSNQSLVEVKDGLQQGQRVLLNPQMLDEQS